MKSGIYKIRNLINNKVYIGKTKNFKKRFSQYVYDFREKRGSCINEHLMNAMIKYGFDNFEFSILEVCCVDECSERELFWMDFYRSCDRNFGYNLRRDSSSGMIAHEETSRKISERLRSEWSAGVRSEHSLKMKRSWSIRDKSDQSEVMRKVLTRYSYKVKSGEFEEIVNYEKLKDMGLKNVVAKFNKHKSDVVKFKGFVIERIYNEDKT